MKKFCILILCVFPLLSCGEETPKKYEYTSPYDNFLISYSSMFKQDNESYYVYIYSPYCDACKHLEEYSENYINSHNPTNFFVVDLYFENEDDISFVTEGDYQQLIGCGDLKDFYLIYTPVLFKLDDKKISSVIYQFNEIANFFNI